ncbi:hypothetical protein MMC10_008948 [Thelotrema lepadinum]|nr:hypothetical protein [Thelotrema lepadinum]
MTDLSRLSISNQVPTVESVVGTNAADTLQPEPRLPNGASVEEEEEYTIKCICDFQDDDGNTIFCETCETWQHIVCYYDPTNVPGKDDNHNCVDCEPRPVDARRATERQRAKRIDLGLGEKKVKKPPAKSHKRKIRPIDHQPLINGLSEKNDLVSPRNGASTNTRDQPPPTKRQKSGHKQSNSIATQSTNIKLPAQSRRSASASHPLMSPSKGGIQSTPDLADEPYSMEFMTLYDDDPGETPMDANIHSGVPMLNDLAMWSEDVDALAEATNGRTPPEVFQRTLQPVNEIVPPIIHKQVREDKEKEYHGRNPVWIYLTPDSDLEPETVIGELRGHVGYMKDYVQNEQNRWEYLRHPLPFVFFHPSLPIYVDTRKSGSLLRYLRRSCQPNLSMKTFLEGRDYHFCWVANKRIEAGTELTIPWTSDEHVRTFYSKGGGVVKHENSAEVDEGYVLDYFSKLFADFGGCACGMPDQCAYTSAERRYRSFGSEQPAVNGKSKKGRKSGNQTSTNGSTRGNASRSGSEAIRHQDDEDLDDAGSTSASSRSKPQSRDITPANQPNSETLGSVQGLEVSERDKRKIAAMEKAEQDKHQPAQKKKKRTSGNNSTTSTSGTGSGTPNASHTRARANSETQKQQPITGKSRYVDAGTSRKQSGSPTSRSTFAVPTTTVKLPLSTSPPKLLAPRPNYVDASMQTDPDPEDQFLIPSSPPSTTPRKPYMSLKKRLLTKAHQEKVAMEERRKSDSLPQKESPTSAILPDSELPSAAAVASSKDVDGDTMMEGSATVSASSETTISPSIEKPRPPDSPTKGPDEVQNIPVLPLQPPPLTISTSNGPSSSSSHGFRNTDLRVTLPSNPLSNGIPSTPSATGQSPIVQTPSTTFTPTMSASITQASPVAKKKLSLGDYISRRGSSIQKPETPTVGASGSSKEKDKDTEMSSPTVPAANELKKPLASVLEDQSHENGEESGITSKESPNKVEIETAAIASLPDSMDVDPKS